MATIEPGADVMIIPGCFEERTVRGIKQHVPNRFGVNADGEEDCEDLTGYISLDGQRTPVQTGYWGGAAVWELDRESAEWPKCPACGADMDIGSAGYWRCAACGHSRYSAKRGA